MSNKKLSQSDELEKQYRDYKLQFEQWKEKNRESVGTDAYVRYVKQFEDWEKDVEKRRMQLRQAAELEADRARMEAERKRHENEQIQKKNDEAAAVAYAEEQASYLSMHQQAIQEEQNIRAFHQQQRMPQHSSPSLNERIGSLQTHYKSPNIAQEVSPASNPQKTPVQSHPSPTRVQSHAKTTDLTNNSMVTVMQQVLSFVMEGGANKSIEKNGDVNEPVKAYVGANSLFPMPPEIAPPQECSPTAPPQLWGNEGAAYPTNDPMFRRWNVRAAPPNFRVPYQPPPPRSLITPGWLMLKKLNENKLSIFAPQQTPAAVVPSVPVPTNINLNLPPPLAGAGPIGYSLPHPLPNMSVPPPLFAKIN